MEKIDLEELKRRCQIEQVARQLGLSGQGKRLWCPSCQAAGPNGHKSPDLALYDDGFKCWKCGAAGDSISLVQLALGACDFKTALRWLQDRFGGHEPIRMRNGPPSSLTTLPTNNNTRRPTHNLVPHVVPPASNSNAHAHDSSGGDKAEGVHQRAALEAALQVYQRALPGSAGEAYLKSRGITLEQAQSFGLGFSAPGLWLHRSRDWRLGRVVFPTHDPDGVLLNMYGRAIELPGVACSNHLRHDICVDGPKGYFGVEALSQETAFCTEGSFDRLALALSGVTNSVCIFGVKSFKWQAFARVRHIVFCFDNDKAGRKELEQLALEGLLRGKIISTLPAFRGCKDLAESYQKYGPIEV